MCGKLNYKNKNILIKIKFCFKARKLFSQLRNENENMNEINVSNEIFKEFQKIFSKK
jgi:hypothetical protein